MNFIEAREEVLKDLQNKLKEIIEKQKEAMKVLATLENSLDFVVASFFLDTNQLNEAINDINNMMSELNKFNTLNTIGTKRKRLLNGELSNERIRTDFDLKTDASWMEDKECTKEQMIIISNSIFYKDKKMFFTTLFSITDNKPLTDRYTKFFFNSSIKHISTASLKS